METTIWIAIILVILMTLFALVFFVKRGKKREKLTPLANIAFILIIFSIFFGDNRAISYSLILAGIILAVIDIIIRARKKK